MPWRPHQREALIAVVCINWATNRIWQTKLLDRRKVTQLNYLRQESVKSAERLDRASWESIPVSPALGRLVGLVVKASASRAEDPEFESRLRRDFSGVESYQ